MLIRCAIRMAVVTVALMGSLPAMGNEQPLALWEARGQHIRLVERDGGDSNSHPAQLDRGQIRQAIGLLRLRPAAGVEDSPMFTPEEADFLAVQLSKALGLATQGQDVSTATIGLRKSIFGLREPLKTTARIFVKNGELNVIFGQVQVEVPDTDSTLRGVDPRLVTEVSGKRQSAATPQPGWQLVSGGEAVALKRNDWAVISLEKLATAGIVEGLSPPAPLPMPRSIADRLRLLDELKEKGLVTPAEYGSKRKQIIDAF